MKTAILIQASINSRRFPNKVFYKIKNKYSIQYIIDECLKTDFDVILLVPETDLKKFNEKIGTIYPNIKIISGSETNVLERFYFAIEKLDYDTYVRLTDDCICILNELIQNTVLFFEKNKDKYDYVSNSTLEHSLIPEDAHNHSLSSNLPNGFSVEVFEKYAIELAYFNTKDKMGELSKYDQEHTTTWIKRNLRCGLYDENFLYINGKFSLDEKKDISSIKSYLKLFDNKFIQLKCLNDL